MVDNAVVICYPPALILTISSDGYIANQPLTATQIAADLSPVFEKARARLVHVQL